MSLYRPGQSILQQQPLHFCSPVPGRLNSYPSFEASVTLYSNTSSIDGVDSAIEPQNYKQNIVPNTNLTQADSSGLSGVLYDRGLSCELENHSNTPLPKLLTEQHKIALVQRGNCSFTDKVIYSQMDGAVGVIIYDQIPFEKDPRAGLMNIPPGNISIVAYYVDLDIGIDLLRKLQQEGPLLHDSSTNASYQKGVKVVLYPAVGGFPSAWEFTLIVVVALLAVSFLASVGMHYHLWRIRRRQRLMFESGLLPPPFTQAFQVSHEKKVIEPSMLTLFPTRTIGDEADIPQPRSSSESARSTRSGNALKNAEALATLVDTQAEHPESSTSPGRASAADLTEDSCVICLDEFSSGDTVRKLPCGHEYHRECIDPWLTIKSASCPLCKHDCLLDVPKTASGVELEPPSQEPISPARSNSPFSLRLFGGNSSSPSSSMFGPTIRADQAEEFSRSWMARSLPRNMRRQINQAAAAAANGNSGPAIELPARMTAGAEDNSLTPPPPPHLPEPSRSRDRLGISLPRQWRL